ncbi:hypothetical protein L5515_008869 [Caenorhabditis briggsae]|uniref:DUF38 domain-containing protein n=1 Tax=Caenorhabditis briggsae TaxID=6238 RepID=A0AAE9JN81_CAEBR|nr:hypothetical protein L5515_008869 [Caenorhabditis briggsae]
MGYAYQWLPTKNNFSSMEFRYNSRSITVKLVSDYIHTKLIYKDIGGGSMSLESGRNSLTIDDTFFNVFCEDFELIIANQRVPTISLVLRHISYYDETRECEEVFLDFITSKLFDCLEKSLKSRKDLFQVSLVILEPVDMDQAMSIILNMDPFKLSLVEISFSHRTNQVNIDGISSLIEWNQGRKLELNMYFGIMSAENLVTVKHLLKHHSTFHRVEIYYKNSDDNLDLSFDVLHQQWVCSVFKQFIFTLRNQEADQLKNEVSASSIDVILSGRVSQNPFIMESVLKNLECFDIQRLRKTSSGIRRCVDYIKPEPHIEKCSIEFDSINRIVTSIAQRNGLFKKVRYGDGKDIYGVHNVHCGKTTMEGEDLGRIVLNDFKINLEHQKTCLEEFFVNFSFVHAFHNRSNPNWRSRKVDNGSRKKVDYDQVASLTSEFTEKTDQCLKSMPPLRVRTLIIGSVNQEDVFRILSHVHPEILKVIEIRYPFKVNVEKCLEVDNICQLKQWNSAEELIINSVTISTGIQEMKITHFVSVDILVENIYAEDIVYLKKELLKSSNFKKFKITFAKSTLDQSVLLSLGEPYRLAGYTRVCFVVQTPPFSRNEGGGQCAFPDVNQGTKNLEVTIVNSETTSQRSAVTNCLPIFRTRETFLIDLEAM